MKKIKSNINAYLKVHEALMLALALLFFVACTVIIISAIFPSITGIGLAGIIIFGPNVNDAYGKTGNVIDSHNAYGHYQRGYKIPSSLTTGQSTVRQRLKTTSKLWKTSPVDRNSWITYSTTHPIMKRGRTINLRGNAWFNEFNIIKQLIGGTGIVPAAPTTDTLFPTLTGITMAVNSTPDTVTIEPLHVGTYPTGMMALVYISKPVSPGIMSYKSVPLTLLGAFDPTLTPAIDVTTQYVALFGTLADSDGLAVWCAVRLAMPTGESTLPVRNNIIIVAGV